MHYAQHLPSLTLRPYVECFWTLNGKLPPEHRQPERILPDGCMEMIFHRGIPFQRLSGSSDIETQSTSFVVGQVTEPVVVIPSHQVDVLGIRFQPGGAFPFLHIPMLELRGRFVELKSVDRWTRRLHDIAANAQSTPEAMSALSRELENRLDSSSGSSRVSGLASTILRRCGGVSLSELAREAGISQRQIEREFGLHVGVSPKMLSRIARFQQVFRAMDSSPSWVQTALNCGYYDQAHLIADFQQFAGTTPGRFQLEEFELGRFFLRSTRPSS